MNIKDRMLNIGQEARAAAGLLANTTTSARNQALEQIAARIRENEALLLAENKKDLDAGERNALEPALMDRLALSPARIQDMADGLMEIAALADPIGEITDLRYRPSGIQVGKMRVPLGVIGIIYESRPNVTADAAGLCIKSANAAILRGGSEALHSNQAIATCIRAGLEAAALPGAAAQVLDTSDRAAVGALLALPDYVDLIIPRGGKGLIARVGKEAQMPVLKHLDGICHVYIDSAADLDKAVAIAYNAKTQRYGTCNTMECLLIAEELATAVLQRLGPMYAKAGVEIRGCAQSRKILPEVKAATEADYASEYLAPVMSLKIVADMDAAIAHIHQYGSQHTDSIVTEDFSRARQFLRAVDSSSVMVNASTRFADGFEYGLGAEIGISTDKFHARGPVGLEGLTSQKYIVLGDGHIRQ